MRESGAMVLSPTGGGQGEKDWIENWNLGCGGKNWIGEKSEDEPAAEAKRSDGGKEAVGPSHLLAEQAERAGERFDADRQTGSCLMQAAQRQGSERNGRGIVFCGGGRC